jgi:hypothetical protein
MLWQLRRPPASPGEPDAADTGGPGGQWQHARDSESEPEQACHCQWHWQGLRLLAPPGRVGEVTVVTP